MSVAFIGVGSNLGDRKAHIERALELLKETNEIKIEKTSSWVETQPVGGPPQDPYLNGAIQIETELLPLELLSRLKNVERRLGRMKAERDAPRQIDLDILLYGDSVFFEGKTLVIPHPRMAERRFVLEPLAEIAPDLVHPKLQKTVRVLLEECLVREGNPPQANISQGSSNR